MVPFARPTRTYAHKPTSRRRYDSMKSLDGAKKWSSKITGVMTASAGMLAFVSRDSLEIPGQESGVIPEGQKSSPCVRSTLSDERKERSPLGLVRHTYEARGTWLLCLGFHPPGCF